MTLSNLSTQWNVRTGNILGDQIRVSVSLRKISHIEQELFLWVGKERINVIFNIFWIFIYSEPFFNIRVLFQPTMGLPGKIIFSVNWYQFKVKIAKSGSYFKSTAQAEKGGFMGEVPRIKLVWSRSLNIDTQILSGLPHSS